ncbi:hypothetical protein STCU_09552 [Strigomonas culicis]|uniref:Bromo domain-containing protein n=1 Tax=Strigomonas culicis TaxID=28005 RepID=S9V8H7_9TRYP|nr:hypothetical protein STCU_09552 [Strigomonas culicis]|eukprot:EPY19260.1 hypothetical protein STCU_09552 [Strigomonas culicis]
MAGTGGGAYTGAELAALIRSLDRAEDNHLFAEDVVKTYPQFAAEYVRACPTRIDLGTAAKRAQEGEYTTDPTLAGLKADVQLMVSNCMAFNGKEGPYADIALRFEKYAMDKIDSFISHKTGGKRVSSLRLQAIPEKPRAQTKKKPPHDGAASAPVQVTVKDMVALVNALVRREDADTFEIDVGEKFPQLKESYDAVCPDKMNLRLMKERAHSGYYLEDTADIIGPTVADSLRRVRADIELIVNNCIRFNARVEEWIRLALSFQNFAHRRVDDFVLRHAPHLRGTAVGATRYAAQTPAPAQAAGGSDAITPASSQPTPPSADAKAVKRPREEAAAPVAQRAVKAGPRVEVRVDSTPAVCPTPLQPRMEVPPALRHRVVADHVRQSELPARLVGCSVPAADLAPHAPEAPSGSVVITPEMSVRAVMDSFIESMHAFYTAQRNRTDFNDPFKFSLKEEAAYVQVVKAIRGQFNRLFPSLLLYPAESAEVQERTAKEVAAATAATPPPPQDEVAWDAAAHCSYLVRFLLQFPQLAALACASDVTATPYPSAAGPAPGRRPPGVPASTPTLKITQDLLEVVKHVAVVCQELLLFIEAYEARLMADA